MKKQGYEILLSCILHLVSLSECLMHTMKDLSFRARQDDSAISPSPHLLTRTGSRPAPTVSPSPHLLISLTCLFLSVSAVAAQPSPPVITKTTVEGNQALSSAEIQDTAGIRPGSRYDAILLEEGLQRLLALYAQRGYIRAEIFPPDVRWSPDSSAAAVTLYIREGPRAEIERIELTGAQVWSSETLLEGFESRPGALFHKDLLERDMDGILTRYEEHGYPYCRLDLTRFQAEEGRLFITITIQEGPFIRVDGFRVEGNTHTKAYVVTRELRLNRGDPFNQRRLKRGRTRLQRLGFFEAVEEPALEVNSSGDGGTVVIRVEEGRSSAIDGVLGYTPGLGGRSGFVTGAVTLSLRNVAGTGRRADAAWFRRDPLTSDIQLQYEEPWILGSPVTVGMDLGQVNQDSSYTARQVGVKVRAPLSDRIDGYIRLGWQRVIPDSASAALVGGSREVNGQIGFTADLRDDPNNPRHGLLAQADLTYGLRWNNTGLLFTPEQAKTQTSRVRVDLEQYIPLIRRHVAAVAVHGVDIRSGERVLPIAQQFRFGGTRTLRGYRENEFRGSRVAWSNLEYRILLSSRSRFFAFFDTGFFEFQRATTGGTMAVRHTRIGYGLGIRLSSSLGILGIDYGIGEDDTLLNGKVHIGLRNEF